MSVHPMSWVLKHSDAKLGDRLVLIVLADHANDEGLDAYPAIPTIALEARLSERQVKRCLSNLKDQGEIVADGKSRYGTTIYTIAGYRRSLGHIVTPPEGDNQRIEGVPSTTKKPADMSPEPSLVQPSIEQPPQHLPAAPVAYDPIKGRRIKGHDHPWNALAAETRAVGEINGARMKRALATIRPIVWDFAQARGATPEKVQADPDAYELAVAETIKLVAKRLATDSPELTWGPEGVARNFAAALARIESNGSIQRIADEAAARARARA